LSRCSNLCYKLQDSVIGEHMSGNFSIENGLLYEVDLQLHGFHKSVPPGTVKQLSFKNIDAQGWFISFYNQLDAAVGNHFLPVYRMADGEFIFCIGRKKELAGAGATWPEKVMMFFRGTLSLWFQKVRSSETTCWGENYAGISRDELRGRYIECLKKVAKEGMLAIHFTRSKGRFSEQYIGPMCHFFDENAIEVNEHNYTSFYFVYALLCGPAISGFVKGRSILIVTSAADSKRRNIESTLLSMGAKSVLFQGISSSRSMLDRLDLSGINEEIDLAFVAAGIGSANILAQLEPLNTVCIDIGACMAILADDSNRGRIFTVSD